MATWSAAARSVNITSSTFIAQITAATGQRVRILEIGVTLVSAVACTIGLGKPATAGTTATVSVTAQPEDQNDAGLPSTMATTMTTVPTAPATFMRRAGLPATIGAGIVWTFPQGLKIATAGSIVLWNITGGGLLDVWWVEDE